MSGHAAAPPQMIDWSQLIAPVPPWGHFLVCSERDLDTAISRFRSHGPKQRCKALPLAGHTPTSPQRPSLF